MAKPKGAPKTGGRVKGTPNKVTGDLKAMILGALDKAGGLDYLAQQAVDNPGPFMALVGKVLPHQVTGADGGPVEMSIEDKRARAQAMLAEAFGGERNG